ncbi:MAG: hypothetical protein V3U60_11125 [Gammaproteobacteria bacterium]
MTEDEAKTKWCPFARVVFEDSGMMGNRLYVQSAGVQIWDCGSRCIGSECMAWRRTRHDDSLHNESGKSYDGFCGLAGKP